MSKERKLVKPSRTHTNDGFPTQAYDKWKHLDCRNKLIDLKKEIGEENYIKYITGIVKKYGCESITPEQVEEYSEKYSKQL